MKVGRNDLCPCGSGKKYKKCCMENGNIIPFPSKKNSITDLTSMEKYGEYCDFAIKNNLPIPTYNEFFGEINSATEALGDFNNEISNMSFNSEEELKNYFDNYMNKQNNTPIEDFLGLTSTQMNNIINLGLNDNKDICTINSLTYNDIKDVLVIKCAVIFMNILLENQGNMLLTSTGNMGVKFCREFVKRLHGLNVLPKHINSEYDVPLITLVKILLVTNQSIDLLKTKVKITTKGEALLTNNDKLTELFYGSFHFFIDRYNWLLDFDFPEECSIIQDTALFSLLILHKKGNKPYNMNELFSTYKIAFPMLEEVDDMYYSNITEIAYEIMFVKEFCIIFGLLEVHIGKNSLEIQDNEQLKFKTTNLFKKLLNWKI
ncbi:MAG: SEC-C domain-containing protein [Spirochaetales bacterium]|nr:SEC-C domain-containing protein [Spirochaetales bacterium]